MKIKVIEREVRGKGWRSWDGKWCGGMGRGVRAARGGGASVVRGDL